MKTHSLLRGLRIASPDGPLKGERQGVKRRKKSYGRNCKELCTDAHSDLGKRKQSATAEPADQRCSASGHMSQEKGLQK